MCSCCMCARGATRRSLAVWRQLTTHTRARREPAQLQPRRAPPGPLFTLHLHRAVLAYLCCVRGRHSLAASRGLQPEITALARRGRNSFDSPLAMMHTRRSSAHVSLTAFCCESCAQDMRPAASRAEGGCAPRRALTVGTLPRPLRGLHGPRHFCQHLLSCLASVFCVAAQ